MIRAYVSRRELVFDMGMSSFMALAICKKGLQTRGRGIGGLEGDNVRKGCSVDVDSDVRA